jgi:hypothetical protein
MAKQGQFFQSCRRACGCCRSAATRGLRPRTHGSDRTDCPAPRRCSRCPHRGHWRRQGRAAIRRRRVPGGPPAVLAARQRQHPLRRRGCQGAAPARACSGGSTQPAGDCPFPGAPVATDAGQPVSAQRPPGHAGCAWRRRTCRPAATTGRCLHGVQLPARPAARRDRYPCTATVGSAQQHRSRGAVAGRRPHAGYPVRRPGDRAPTAPTRRSSAPCGAPQRRRA